MDAPIAASPIVVLGGGISGLAAAHRLTQIAPGVQITLVEAAKILGGKIATEHVDGFVIEAGPDSFLAAKPRGIGLCQELGIAGSLVGPTPRRHRAFVLFQDRLHELPEGLSGLVPTRIAPLARSTLLSARGKARVALDYVLPPRGDDGDEALGAFIRRRLGDEAWERLVEPLMAGIYAADGDQLSLAATFPQLADAERRHGGLIRGVLAARLAAPTTSSPAPSPFLAPASGLGEMVAVLERSLREHGVRILTGVAAETVTSARNGYDVGLTTGETIPADAVIIATPAFASADLLAALDPALTADLRDIPHASTAIVTLAYRREAIPHALEGHGYVVPRIAGGSILASTWSSRKWPGRSPEGWELIRVFVGRAGQEDAMAGDDDQLVMLARQEVAKRLGIAASPSLTRVRRWPRGMPQYLLGHPSRIARIEAAVQFHSGLYLAGNAFHGVGIPDCIASGERAAVAAAEHLRGSSESSRQGKIAIPAR